MRIWNRLTLTIYGWEFHEQRRPFEEYTPGGKVLCQGVRQTSGAKLS